VAGRGQERDEVAEIVVEQRRRRGGDVIGRRGADVTQGKVVSCFIAPLLCIGGFGRGGPDIAERATRGGSTTGKPPISRTLTIDISRNEKICPP